MTTSRVLLIDSDDHSASVLLQALHDHGIAATAHVAPGLDVPAAMTREKPAVVVFNHRSDRPDELLSCSTARLAAPDVPVVALASAGPSLKAVREWAAQTGSIEAVLEKPLRGRILLSTVDSLLERGAHRRALEVRADRLASMLPDGALSVLSGEAGQEELFEATVLFTDIRRSSELITRVPPREFFALLNRCLGMQSGVVRGFDGELVKYTGDGLMAVFRGMGRSYLALRCALELAAARDPALPFGIGVAEGLVLAGLVGQEGAGQRRQYDVIGATVHLASRLCSMAAAGEVVCTRAVHAASRLDKPPLRPVGKVAVRGFPTEIECMALGAGQAHPSLC